MGPGKTDFAQVDDKVYWHMESMLEEPVMCKESSTLMRE